MKNENQPEEIHPEEEVATVAELSATAQAPVQTPAFSPEPSVLSPVLTESINPRIPTEE